MPRIPALGRCCPSTPRRTSDSTPVPSTLGGSHLRNVNYDVGNRELLAVRAALEEWRHWLEGAEHPFLVWSDHQNLVYIRTAKRLGERQARWAHFFSRSTSLFPSVISQWSCRCPLTPLPWNPS